MMSSKIIFIRVRILKIKSQKIFKNPVEMCILSHGVKRVVANPLISIHNKNYFYTQTFFSHI
jgi:hypothetical protein